MRRRWAQVAVAARIARRQAARSRGRTALVASMVGLPVLVASTLAVLLVSGVPTEATMLRVALGDELEARVELSCAGIAEQDEYGNGSCTVHGAMLRTEQLEPDLAAALPAGTTLVHEARGEVEAEGAAGRRHHLTYVEVDVSVAEVADVFRLHQGRLPRADGEVALSRRVSDGLVPAVGDRLTVRVGDASREVTVVGVLSYAHEGPDVLALPGAGPVALEPDPVLGAPARWYVDSPVPVDWATVRDLNRLGVTVLSRAVVLDPPDPAEMTTDLESGWLATDSRTAALTAAAVGAGLLEAVLLIGPAFAVGARRSVRDLALLATVGAERRDLRRVVLLGAVVIGGGASLAGAVVGAALGLGVAWVAGERFGTFPNLVVPWPYLAGFVVLGVVVATAAAWLPARRASRVDVVAALGGRRAEQHPHPAVPVIGVVAVLLGGMLAVAGAMARSTALALLGTALGVLGLVTASGAVVALVARLAPRCGVATR
ncbi:ABC transporter permease, partial [Cellulomonas sp. APG4]|uniref:ABC transporter permease n=1 Tax=Cellulomonas sp. APG4 TaxID=1538656 RepID=UPI00137B647A